MTGRRRRILIALLVVVVAVAAVVTVLVVTAGASLTGQVARLSITDGRVEVRSGALPFRPGTEGQALRAGDAVKTGSGGRAELRYFDGSTTRLDPGTTFTVATLGKVKDRADSKVIVGYQQTGSSVHRIGALAGADSKVNVWTAAAVASVRGTAFRVSVSADAAVTLAVDEGKVALVSPRRELLVEAGGRQTLPFTGPCTAFINGVNIDEAKGPKDAIPIREGSGATLVGRSSEPITGHTISLEVAGRRFVASKGDDEGNVWTGSVETKSYARYGVGVYKVIAESSGPGGCRRTAFIEIEGRNPLTTVAGAGGAAAAGIGVVGGVFVVAGAPGARRRGWRIALGLLLGLLASVGTLVVLQQTSLVYPTLTIALVALVAGVLAGGLGPWLLSRLLSERSAPPAT